MHESMFAALKTVDEKNNMPKEIEIAEDLHKKELAEAKSRYEETIRGFEKQISELRAEVSKKDSAIQANETEKIERDALLKRKESEFESQKKE